MIESIFNFSSLFTSAPVQPYKKELSDHERLSTLALHVDSDDYFRALSTLLGFAEEVLATGEQNLTPILVEAVAAARKDLNYLHDHYRILPRA